MYAKKWVKLWFVFGFASIFLIGLFNYVVDSFGLISKNSYLDKAAKELANGKIVAGLKNFDERIFRKKIIENLQDPPQWIAIGSSRIMQLRKRFFLENNQTFQNLAVSGASLEDYMALIQVYKNHFKKLPKNIIFGIDPWIFNKYNGQNRYLSLVNEYNQFLQTIGYNNKKIKKNIFNNYIKLLSIEYLKENIKFIINNVNNELKGYYIVNSINIDDYLREPDGSIQYPYRERYPNKEQVIKKAIAYGKPPIYSLLNFKNMSNLLIFERFINYLLEHNVKVYFCLPPYNPLAYNSIIKHYPIIINVEYYLKSFANKHNILVIGSYNPYDINLTIDDFFDGMHTLDSAYIKLFSYFKYYKK